jgi:hypothetical protein
MRLRVAAAIAALMLLAPALSRAYVPSPQYGAFELKFGPYRPNVDDEPGLTGTPYRDSLDNDNMFLTMLELDWQFLQLRGINFGIGGAFGFMQAYAKAQTESGGESADYTVLNVMPFNLLAVIRIDVLARELHVPLVPFFKGGLNWYLWWVLDGGGDTAASGGTMGWQINPGLAIELDSLDRMSARTFDNEVGVNHSYLFFEYVYAQVEGYGRDGYMYLSPTNMGDNGTFMIGLAVEF